MLTEGKTKSNRKESRPTSKRPKSPPPPLKKNIYHGESPDTKNLTIENQIEILKEDIECVHMYLDDLKVPRFSNEGTNSKEYSVNGRIQYLVKALSRI